MLSQQHLSTDLDCLNMKIRPMQASLFLLWVREKCQKNPNIWKWTSVLRMVGIFQSSIDVMNSLDTEEKNEFRRNNIKTLCWAWVQGYFSCGKEQWVVGGEVTIGKISWCWKNECRVSLIDKKQSVHGNVGQWLSWLQHFTKWLRYWDMYPLYLAEE